MRINVRILRIVSFSYVYIPILIFIFGWTNILVSLICVFAGGYLCFRAYKNAGRVQRTADILDEDYVIDLWVFIAVLLFLLWLGYYSGIGRFVAQTSDWQKHNAVLYDLVNKPWPVYYVNGDHHSMLTYYIGQYLLPALLGKIAHSARVAEVVNYLWAETGLLLVYLNLVVILRPRNIVMNVFSAIVMCFFSVPMWLAELVMKRLLDINRVGEDLWFYIGEGIMLQYTSNFALLRWVFAQTITIWLITLLFYQMRSCLWHYVLIFLPGIMYGTLAFLGFIPIAAVSVAERLLKTNDKREIIKQIFDIENILLMATLGTVFALYFYGNIFGDKPDGLGLQMVNYGGRLGVYLCFIGINILLYIMCTFKDFKSDYVFLGTVGTLLLIPFLKMGMFNDFGMRASIPPLFLMMLYILIFINTHLYREGEGKFVESAIAVLFLLLVIGAYYEERDLVESIANESYLDLGNGISWESMEQFANPDDPEVVDKEDLAYNYYSYDIEDNLFYKFIARKKLSSDGQGAT